MRARQTIFVTVAIFFATSVFGQGALEGDGQSLGTKIVIQDIKRDEGGTITLRFQMVNETDKKFGGGCDFREEGSECGFISGVHLIDGANKKKYLVVRDEKRKCVCAEFGAVPASGRLNLWAKFPAPPAEVQKITVVVPHFQPIESVPITGR